MSTAYLTLYRNLDLFPKNGYPFPARKVRWIHAQNSSRDHQESVWAIAPRLDAIGGSRNATSNKGLGATLDESAT